MKKAKTAYEEAIVIYTTFYGTPPAFNEITGLYHKYANEWKHFDGFMNWLTYNG
jgi:hypothetical protein